jgi:hypothetical protein
MKVMSDGEFLIEKETPSCVSSNCLFSVSSVSLWFNLFVA